MDYIFVKLLIVTSLFYNTHARDLTSLRVKLRCQEISDILEETMLEGQEVQFNDFYKIVASQREETKKWVPKYRNHHRYR